jgi:peptidoglycan/xylan/chitin deacetylase (PgdA/CDA1 family)
VPFRERSSIRYEDSEVGSMTKRWCRALSILGTAFLLLAAAQAPPQDVEHAPVGILPGSSLERLGVTRVDFRTGPPSPAIRYNGITRFLDRARTVVTGTLDDSTTAVPNAIDAMDAYGIKATIAVSTQGSVIGQLWPRLRAAVDNGHEVGSHSRRHQCQWPDTEAFCRAAYSRDEIEGSRDDILAHTSQRHVWTWVYPCGNCAGYEFIHRRLNLAGYLVARNYPDEVHGGHLVPDLQSWAADPYNAAFTQSVQRQGGIAPAGRTDVALLNRKFDQVHPVQTGAPAAGRGSAAGRPPDGGIYQFMTHPSLLDFGPEQFFEKHLAHIGGRPDVWYVPTGPLYAYQIVRENTVVTPLGPKDGWERFAVHHDLDPKIYDNAVTLAFATPEATKIEVRAGGKVVPERTAKLTDRWNAEYFRRDAGGLLVTVRPNTIVELKEAK